MSEGEFNPEDTWKMNPIPQDIEIIQVHVDLWKKQGFKSDELTADHQQAVDRAKIRGRHIFRHERVVAKATDAMRTFLGDWNDKLSGWLGVPPTSDKDRWDVWLLASDSDEMVGFRSFASPEASAVAFPQNAFSMKNETEDGDDDPTDLMVKRLRPLSLPPDIQKRWRLFQVAGNLQAPVNREVRYNPVLMGPITVDGVDYDEVILLTATSTRSEIPVEGHVTVLVPMDTSSDQVLWNVRGELTRVPAPSPGESVFIPRSKLGIPLGLDVYTSLYYGVSVLLLTPSGLWLVRGEDISFRAWPEDQTI